MATKAELTKKVDDLTAAATTARTTWKEAIPGPDDPKMTDEEQAEVYRIEEVYNTAKAARKAAERELAAWIEAQRVAASAGTPVNTPAPAPAPADGNDDSSASARYYLGY